MKIYVITCFLALILLSDIATGQGMKYPAAVNSRKGIVILAGNPLSPPAYYRIERTTVANENYQDIGILASPTSFKQFRALAISLRQFFYPMPFDSMAYYSAWDDLQKSYSRFSPGNFMMHPSLQVASGMAFLDTSARDNITYRYRVSEISGSEVKMVGITDAITFPTTGKQAKPLFRKKSISENRVIIEWYSTGNDKPSWFEVYRKQVQKSDFNRINPVKGFYNVKDTLVMVIMDTLVRSEDNYEYYILPYDFWAGSFQPSEIIRTATTTDQLLPVVLRFTTKGIEKQKAILLKWTIQKYPYIRSISILRSDNYDGKYEKIAELSPADSMFTDRMVEPVKTYYYRIVINAMNKNTYPSARVAGMMKPADVPLPPVDLHAEDVKNGVLLTWRSLDNQLFGCIVYRCYGYKGQMIQVSDMLKVPPDLNFQWLDSSSVLRGKTIFSYSVKAVNKGNIESRFSDTVSILPAMPREVPMTPVRVMTRVFDNKIYISWEDMYRFDPYVAGYNIYKKAGANDWQQLNSSLLKQNDNLFTDTTAVPGIKNEYSVETVDIFNVKSPRSLPVSAVIEIIKPPAPAGLTVYKTDDGILVKWDGVVVDGLAGYKIYRSDEDGRQQLIYTAKPDEFDYLDKGAKKDGLWIYSVTAFLKDGSESEPGFPVSIRK